MKDPPENADVVVGDVVVGVTVVGVVVVGERRGGVLVVVGDAAGAALVVPLPTFPKTVHVFPEPVCP